MKPVTVETVRERMNELGSRIASGRISLREEFELACLRELLELMEPRTVKLPTTRLWAGKIACFEESDVIAILNSAGLRPETE